MFAFMMRQRNRNPIFGLFQIGWVAPFWLFVACNQPAETAENVKVPISIVSQDVQTETKSQVLSKISGSLSVLTVEETEIRNMHGEPVVAASVEEPDLVLHFIAEKREDVRIWIADPTSGEVHKRLYEGRAKPGLNVFRFQHDPLPLGDWEIFVAFEAGADTVQRVTFRKSKDKEMGVD
jgi:hypothetical protein